MSILIPRVNGDTIPSGRSGHIGVYHAGHLLVHGGYTNSEHERYPSSNEIWCYNIELSIWTRVSCSGNPPSGGVSGSCAVVLNDTLFIFGGFYPSPLDRSDIIGLRTANLYSVDLRKFQFTNQTGNIKGGEPLNRDKHCAWTCEPDSRILFFGGFGNAPDEPLTTAGEFVYDEYAGGTGWNNQLAVLNINKFPDLSWEFPEQTGDIPCPRAAHTSAQVSPHTGYLFGGRFKTERRNDLYKLDLRTYKWTRLSGGDSIAGPCGRSWHVLVGMPTAGDEGSLFLYGGYDTEGNALSDIWIWDIAGDFWTEIAWDRPFNLSYTRMWHCAVHSHRPGDILIFGGCETSLLGSQDPVHSNLLAVFRYSPPELVTICMDRIVLDYTFYEEYICCLPPDVLKRVQSRVELVRGRQGRQNHYLHAMNTRTCSLMYSIQGIF